MANLRHFILFLEMLLPRVRIDRVRSVSPHWVSMRTAQVSASSGYLLTYKLLTTGFLTHSQVTHYWEQWSNPCCECTKLPKYLSIHVSTM